VLVLVFPTWWFGMPAILKGWFDRVWAPGIAYDHAADLGRIRPRLSALERVVAITTLGSPWWVDRLVMRRPIRRILKSAILATCAPRARLTFLSFYGCERLDDRAVASARSRVGRIIATI
jgi:putative NADPH-quinone reductase